ncbi:Ig-like domain-containing protein [Gemmatimonas sp.]|uniref:Ig-like domain-containing protein n=1 Tax=Gemmatimonas sp. TaxID=1962908 RepID=UPI00286DA38D|nr:Ig-like domain-containing protein [Gemmatimonas sp.]
MAPVRTVRAWLLLSAAALLACNGGDSTGPDVISAPTGVTVTLTSLTSVRVDWTANPARESVQRYTVLRNGSPIRDVTVPTYIDFGLTELQTYVYTVVAVGSGSAQSAPSAVTAQSTFTLPDLTGPTIASSVPAANATNVAITAPISVTASEPLDPATVSSENVVLRATGTTASVPGVVAYTAGASSFTFTPSIPLTPSTAYTFDVSTALRDRAANRLLAAYRVPFTTAAPIDATPPSVVAFSPVAGAVDVSVRTTVTATFSEAMNAATINSTSMTLAPTAGGAAVPATVSYTAGTRTATLTPTAPLAASSSYTARVTTAAADAAGNGLTAVSTWQFVTSAPVDESAPTVTLVSPAAGATSVPLAAVMAVTFSEAMNPATITAATVTLTRAPGAVPVPAVVEYAAAANRATLTPAAPLTLGANYTVTVTTGARDVSGNPLASPFTSTFATLAADVIAPTVTGTFPSSGAVNVNPTATLTATFSETMQAASLTAAAFVVRTTTGGTAVAGSVSYNAATRTLSFAPTARLAGNTGYTATITTAALDSAGNALAAARVFTFTTAATTDDTPPRVASSVPAENAAGVDIMTTIAVRFDEAMDVTTMTNGAVVVRVANTVELLSGSSTYDSGTNTLTFRPTAPLEYVTTYTVSVGGGARDLAGNRVEPKSFNFQTRPAPARVETFTPSDRSSDHDAATPVSVTFSLPMISSTINASTFILRSRNTALLVPGTVSYNSATRTATFTPSSPLANNSGYVATVTTGVTDVNGQALEAQAQSCFTPRAGAVTAVSMSGFWSGESACTDVHWHVRLVQSGSALSLDTTGCDAPANAGRCQLSALNAEGALALGGQSNVRIASVTGSVSGNAVTFTLTGSNGLTFTFTGAFTNANGSPNPWIIGSIGGATLRPVGITFEKQSP